MRSQIERLKLGDFEVFRLIDGTFRVDGGAMFGVVPRTLWEKRAAPDADNRITLSLNCYLIRNGESIILVETGVGFDVDRRFAEFYSLERPHGLFQALGALGLRPEDIDIVINSHLHFDHCGGNTIREKEKNWRPAYPRARYVFQKGEWAQALNPAGRDKPSYIPARLLCLETCGVLELIEGDVEIAKGVRTVLTPGHTAFHQGLEVTSDSQVFFYFGDTIPTAAHVDLPYIMSFDLFPAETFETKKKLFERAVEGKWIVSFSHDMQQAFGQLRKIERKYESVPFAD